MSDVLVRIKRAVLRGRMRFTEKALIEMRLDALSREDVAESMYNYQRGYEAPKNLPNLFRKANSQSAEDLFPGHRRSESPHTKR
ncbi:MAG: hypothetical protein ABSB74_06005 [Tepidisphaeraceae bacterium]